MADFADQGSMFDPNTLIDSTASLTDPTSLPDEPTVQSFLLQTPYGGASFLATYASNGVTAAQAIVNASATYQINPLVFVVRAQMDQALGEVRVIRQTQGAVDLRPVEWRRRGREVRRRIRQLDTVRIGQGDDFTDGQTRPLEESNLSSSLSA